MTPKEYCTRKIAYREAQMVNICDEELLGMTLMDGELKVEISKDYFSGERVDEESAIKMVREMEIITLVGDRIVTRVVKEHLAHPKAIRKVAGVPMLMIYKFAT